MNRKSRKNYFRNKLKENCGKPKAFWDTLRQVLPSKKNRTEINKLVVDGEELIDKRDIANSLNEFFTTIAFLLLASQKSNSYSFELQQVSPLTVPSHSFIFCAMSETTSSRLYEPWRYLRLQV